MITVRTVDKDGKIRDAKLGEVGSLIEGDETVWVDAAAPGPEEFRALADQFGWHPLAVEDCLIENHLPKIDDYGDHVLLVLHALDTGDEGGFRSREVEVFLGRNYLVTHHAEAVGATDALVGRLNQNPGLARRGPAFLLFLLLEAVTGLYLSNLDLIEAEIEAVEDAVSDSPGREALQRIHLLRRDVTRMRRVVAPQIDVIRRLGRGEFTRIDKEAAAYFRDIYDDLFRITQTIDTYRELLTSALDSYLSSLSIEMNQVMKVLTVFAAIMLPLTFLAGVWGMNFRHMPELAWLYGYPAALGVMAITAAGLLVYFRRRGWL